MNVNDALNRLQLLAPTPAYDRAALRNSIVHLGVGGFHRAHQSVYLDNLARAGNLQWGETGVSFNSRALKEALQAQDGLYTVVERDSSVGERASVVGAMTRYLFAPDDPRAVLDRLAAPETRIVTLTVTGDGYPLDENGDFSADPSVAAPYGHGAAHPSTWFGYVVAALARRRAAGLGGFTVLSCDNLPDSGGAARATVVGCAKTVDRTLARWIELNVSFPHSMVDRITPSSGDEGRRIVAERFGMDDRAPVLTEPFSQWVIEDTFVAGRPPLEDVGVEFTSDVAPYKLMKSRLLNGTHSAMAYLGHLAGHRTTTDVLKDPVMRGYLQRMMSEEIAPLVGEVPGIDLADYQQSLLDRFANEHIGDSLARLCGRGSTKVPTYLLPSLVESRRAGRRAPLLTLAVAAWFRYLQAEDLEGRPIEIVDARRDELVPLARAGKNDPGPLLSMRAVMGSLGDDLGTRHDLASALRDLERLGARGATERRERCGSLKLVRPRGTSLLEDAVIA